MKLSVIIANHNYAEFVGAAICQRSGDRLAGEGSDRRR